MEITELYRHENYRSLTGKIQNRLNLIHQGLTKRNAKFPRLYLLSGCLNRKETPSLSSENDLDQSFNKRKTNQVAASVNIIDSINI
jgi:hypothetical protein